MKHQPRLRNSRTGEIIPRLPAGSTLDPRIKEAIRKECQRYGVSASFVIANALAFVFDIDHFDYRPRKRRKKSSR